MSHSSSKQLKSGVIVTDIVMRGGGGTITFSDNVTVEWVWQFRKNDNVPAGGTMAITLEGDRANLVYQTVVDQTVCNFFDWLLQCTTISNRLALLELTSGRAIEVIFTAADWALDIANKIKVIPSGSPGAGEIGPHSLPVLGKAYAIAVFEDSGISKVIGIDIELEMSLATGEITIIKSPLTSAFDGRIIITPAI